MKILNQPHHTKIGNELKQILDNNASYGFDRFYIIVAYVKQSGVLHLGKSIQKFKTTGGQVKAVVGIDQRNTSIQGLKLLLYLCDELYVYHNERPINTFHPKVYVFEKEKQKAIVFVGSSNLTEGGLYTNYEVNAYAEYDLTKTDQAKEYASFKQMFADYSKVSKMSMRLDLRLIDQLKKGGYVTDEDEERSFSASRMGRTSSQRTPIFGTEYVSAPHRERKRAKQKRAGKSVRKVSILLTRGKLLWRKQNLPSSDAQDVKSGTAPTGGLRLTQAKWKVDEQIIDQTTYFRNELFRELKWKTERTSPFVEVAQAQFHLRISGKDLGVQRLTIRHKPSGEAGQHNYTTLISWGKFSGQISRLHVTGKTLSLYAPPENRKEPFFIEID